MSDIVASVDPTASARKLRSILTNFQLSFANNPLAVVDLNRDLIINRESVLEGVRRLMLEIREMAPLVHQVGCLACLEVQRG